MGKEVKIGLAVIAVLLSVFGGVLYMRLRGGDSVSTAAAKKSTAKENDGKQANDKKKSTAKLSSGPAAAKIAANHRADRYSSSSKQRSGKPETIIDARGDADAGSEGLTDGQSDMTVNDSSPPSDRYGNRDQDRYGTTNELPADDADEASSVANLDDSPASRDDEESGVAGESSTDGGVDDAISDVPEPERPDRAMADAGRDGHGQRPRMARVDEPESNEPPSELGPADLEAPLSPDDRDQSVVEPVGGNRFGRGTRDGGERPVSTASRRSAALMEPADDGTAPGEADALDIEGETYTVRPNDNYWTISQRVYGTGSYFKALQEFNRDRYPNPDRLDVGDAVSVPDVAVLEQTYPKLCPKRRHVAAQQRTATFARSRSSAAAGQGATYTVAEGDTLFDIARRELGSAERWAEIHDLNRDQLGDDIHYLSPGTRLTMPGDNLPADQPRDRVTTRPRRAASRR
ncbi:MAG TPA: LysM peptidoglycan-binding domain-containing protein [Pirellulales bacterium]|nr:LysM peptidoglycan-binding domain-containing protein [Pirellulales bacterium]